jgi:hypothetical protein
MSKNAKTYKWAIEMPRVDDPEAPYETYEYYPTKKAALQAARHHFGADSKGRLNIISKLPQDS